MIHLLPRKIFASITDRSGGEKTKKNEGIEQKETVKCLFLQWK